jgi:hypothetical protein
MSKPRWERIGVSPRAVTVRTALAVFVFGAWLVILVLIATNPGHGSGRFIWPTLYLFVAWRFSRLGVYVSDWGVRICNPIVTWWYPWRRIDRFELGPTGEMFAPKAQAIVLVTTSGRRRLAWGLASSMLFFRKPEDGLATNFDLLNARRREATSAGV